jgi:3-oxoacyl-[acyl-carrier protein] reductase
MNLSGKTAIVTGGSSGIGAATVAKFIQNGAMVIIWDTVEPDLAKYPAQYAPDYYLLDVTDPEQVEKTYQETIKKHPVIDILINNAGITSDAQLVKWKDGQITGKMSAAQFQKVLQVNLNGVFNCTQSVTPGMIANGGGVVLNASSVVGIYGNFGQTNYVASKAAVIGMTKTWARELGRYHIRVNAVAPGFVLTDMVKKMPPDVLKEMEKHTPLGRLGEPEDIANLYAFLSSDEANYIHGAVISIDGGLVPGT